MTIVKITLTAVEQEYFHKLCLDVEHFIESKWKPCDVDTRFLETTSAFRSVISVGNKTTNDVRDMNKLLHSQFKKHAKVYICEESDGKLYIYVTKRHPTNWCLRMSTIISWSVAVLSIAFILSLLIDTGTIQSPMDHPMVSTLTTKATKRWNVFLEKHSSSLDDSTYSYGRGGSSDMEHMYDDREDDYVRSKNSHTSATLKTKTLHDPHHQYNNDNPVDYDEGLDYMNTDYYDDYL
ncbi:MAG: hypothetical protein ACTSUE_11110 [Promethearchaeota archaeon]